MAHELSLLAHIEKIAAGQSAAFPRVLVGPGHDCAAVRTPRGDTLLLTVDQVIEGRHAPSPPGGWGSQFTGVDHLSRDELLDLYARKAVARSVSDVAAMGGEPWCGLCSAALPAGFPAQAARVLADATHRWGSAWKCPMVGGDVASFAKTHDGPLTISLSVVGVCGGRPITRAGAKPGDKVYVTGHIGGSLQAGGLGRHMTFEPRVREGAMLRTHLGDHLHAMIDVSDGLGLDASRVATSSGVAITLYADRIPLSPGVHDVQQAISDGEDYELLFCASSEPGPLGETPVTCIGEVSEGCGVVMVDAGGARTDVSRAGWEH
ncbi:MAG: thiamine-phosphate kinase [Phycisphaerales bacterium]|jgi:thiamine-monophosphate kinase